MFVVEIVDRFDCSCGIQPVRRGFVVSFRHTSVTHLWLW